jgi:hypothetical protein
MTSPFYYFFIYPTIKRRVEAMKAQELLELRKREVEAIERISRSQLGSHEPKFPGR